MLMYSFTLYYNNIKRIPTAVAKIFVAANVVAIDFVIIFNAALAMSFYGQLNFFLQI